MEIAEFSKKIITGLNELDINISEDISEKFYNYMNLLLEWNEKINLTAITNEDEIILKHFIDSLTILKFIGKNSKIIDIGTGAGFPGIPVSLVRDDCNIVLMDSLNKRIKFLDEVICKNKLKNIETIHARAEELARDKEYREKFDIATSRAVASLNVLLEYMLPFVKVGGFCICMKGANIEEELKNAKKALEVLGGKVYKIENFYLPGGEFCRNIIIIKKVKETLSKYPRKAGTPAKEPLI